jgi:predicted KAP-like P-loop ATPase
MLAYAAKLIELGVNGKKDIQGLLKPTDWFTENKSASQAYNELKKIIEKIDIKTIVIIDDVDRLGKDEIFEVLRIIRNTANFPNTIFIVAYDKDYGIKMIDQDLMYLDKYFQYELFVPPHRGEDLLKAFSEMVLHNEMGLGAEQLEKLKEVIKVETLNKTLLDRFVLNYRDVKVLTNIYCATIRLLKEEVDYGDLLHFTLMNRYFPKQVRYIYNNSDELFDPINSTKKKLEFKKRDFLKKPITVDSFIADLNIEEDSQKKLFKRLFIVLFGIKDDIQTAYKCIKTLDGLSTNKKPISAPLHL